MDLGFRIAAIEITAFRGVPALKIEMPADAPLYVIGANNAGKSTVINAFALALRGGGFHTWVPERFDFYHAADGTCVDEFTIDLHLVPHGGVLPAVQGVGNPTDVHRLRVVGCVERGGRFTHRHVLVDGAGNAITYSSRTALKGATKERLSGVN